VWAKQLASDLATFHKQSCLPQLDGLALRQRQRLEDLGVPGLGGGAVLDEKGRERVVRIMDVLEAGLEE